MRSRSSSAGLQSAAAAETGPCAGRQRASRRWHPLPREQTTVLGQPRGPRSDLRMSPEQTRSAVEKAGFKLGALIELPPYHYAAVFERET